LEELYGEVILLMQPPEYGLLHSYWSGAGVAAAEAIKTKTSLNSVNISNVQKVLRTQNVRVF